LSQPLDPWRVRELEKRRQELLVTQAELMDRNLHHALEIGVPVYNLHYPDENVQAAADEKAACHAWVRRTGGDVFQLSGSESDVRKILQLVESDLRNAYIVKVRHSGRRSRPRLRVLGKDGWKLRYTEEFQSFRSRASTLTYRIVAGTAEQRLESAQLARRFESKPVRQALRRQYAVEPHEPVRQTLAESLYSMAVGDLCADSGKARRQALDDLELVRSRISDPDLWNVVAGELFRCVEHAAGVEALIGWWREAEDPRVARILQQASTDAVLQELFDGDLSRALQHAKSLGDPAAGNLFRDYLRHDLADDKARRRVQAALDAVQAAEQ